MLNSGMRHWVASALSMATGLSPRFHTAIQPKSQPIFGLARRVAHWYDEPLSGIRAANCANTKATRICPTATIGNSQMPTGPEFFRTWLYVAKTPITTDTDAKEIANIWKELSVLFSSGL